MPRIELAPEVFDDFDRIFDHLTQHESEDAPARIEEIAQAIQILARSPFVGRPLRGGMRELVIGRRTRGYVALYRYVPLIDVAFVLAVRSQREAGYERRRRR